RTSLPDSLPTRRSSDLVCRDHRLPVNDVIRVNVGRSRASIARREVLEKLSARAGRGPHSCDLQVRAEDLVQVFLLGPEILALARFAKPEQVAIKMQTDFRIHDSNRSMIDTEEEVIGLFLPTRLAYARWIK